MNIAKAIRRNQIEWALILLGIVVLFIQFAVAKNFLSEGGVDHSYIIGAPLDDTYIHCRYAENLQNGKGYTFNPVINIDDSLFRNSISSTVSADTSPLWVVLIALGGIFSNHLDLIAIILSVIFYLYLGPMVFRLCRYTFMQPYSWSIIAGALTVLSSRLVWASASGMEVTLACFVTLLVFHEHLARRQSGDTMRMREGVFLALGIAVRPELMFLAFLFLIDWFVIAIQQRKGFLALVKGKMTFLLCVLPVFLIPYFERGSLIYHSSIVQGAHISLLPDIGYLWFAFKVLIASFSFPILFAFFSFFFLRKQKGFILLVIFGFGLPILLAFIAPQFRHHGRYLFPIIPVLIILGIMTAATIFSNTQLKKFIRPIQILFIIIGCIGAWRGVLLSAESVTNINDQHLAVAAWVLRNTSSNDRLAVDDVGALGYFTKAQLIDLTGLISPEFYFLQHDQKLVWREARKQRANLFIIYTRLNPSFYEYAKDSLQLIKEFRVRPPLVASADTVMSIFRVKGDLHAAR